MPTYCKTCILPEDRPGVRLDAEGICGGCRNAEIKATIAWSARAEAFEAVAAHAKQQARSYDCVIPVSGGKDSFWQVVTCLEHGLHPLCVTYVYPGRTALGERNLRQLTSLGVDHFEFRPSPAAERAFVSRAFHERAISGLATHMAIASVPIQAAVAHRIPLVVYGENSAFEYGSEEDGLAGARLDRPWLERFGVTDGTVAEDWIGDGLSRTMLTPYMLPADDVLEAAGIQAIFLGYYFPWDPENSRRVAVAHGFEARAQGARVGHYDFANVDDDMLGVHHHPKWHKFGITRSWDTLSMEIRAGRLTRREAIERIRAGGDETPWEDIDLFCSYLGIDRRAYFEVLERHRNTDLWSRHAGRWVIEDFLIPDFAWAEDPSFD